MPFPLNPVNGAQTTQNGILYIYNSTLGVWAVLTNTAGNISANNIVVTNSVTGGNLTATGTITGNGRALTSLSAANLDTGTVPTGRLSGTYTITVSGAATTAGTVTTAAQPNITSVGTLTGLTVSSTITGSVSGSAGTAGSATTAGTVTTAAQPNITSVGTLSSATNIAYDGTADIGQTNNNTMLEIRDTGATSTPSMAFHRPNLWATKIVLNTDNQLYFGGWSAAAGGQTIRTGTHSPGATNTYDLGTTALRWRNIYTQDLHLNNGVGDWTIVEGEDDLFLYNNKKNQVYKFAIIEVDPSEATPKIADLNKANKDGN